MNIYQTSVFILILLTIIQFVSTSCTNTKRFSYQAYIRNLLIVYSVYFTVLTHNALWLVVPIVFQIGTNAIMYFTNSRWQSYLTTEYLHSDYFEYFANKNACLQYYTEGDYSKIFDIDTLDTSPENVRRVFALGKQIYDKKPPVRISICENTCTTSYPNTYMQVGQNHKFQWIIDHLDIKSNHNVLEIGFGKLDLMRYIRKYTGANVMGTNLSQEQVRHARADGFMPTRIHTMIFKTMVYREK